MHIYKVVVSMALVICLIVCPFCTRVNANPVITSWVIGAFLAVAISMGFYFDINLADISTWVTAKIEAYLQANGFNSIEAWLGANFEAEATISGNFLGLTPNLYARLKAAVEFSIGTGSDDLPQGGTESSPVARSLLSNYYLPCTITIPNVGSFTGDYPIINYEAIADRSPDWNFVNNATQGYRYQYNIFPLSFDPTMSAGWTQFTIISNNINYNYQFYIDNIYSLSDNTKGTLSLRNYPTTNTPNLNTLKAPINNWNMSSYYANSSYNIQLAFIPHNGDYTKLKPCFIYKAINGVDYLCYFSLNGMTTIPAFSNGNGDITAFGVGTPGYNFNNSDLIYIDLQLGQINSVLQALLALIAAINDNLISWTVAIQTLSPEDLPVNTSAFIDFVDYCNEQTNLYLSGTSSLSACVGNMYQQLYNTISTLTSAPLSDACINAYNAFINKLTLFSTSSDPGGSLSSVQAFQDALSALTGTYNQKITNATSLLDTYINNATGLQEIIGLYNAFTSYCESLGFQINLVTDTKSSISQMNNVVDRYIAGTITSDQALTSLLALYKTGITNSNTADQLGAIVSAYQACVDRVTLNDLAVDPNGLGQTADDVIQMEDDLISHIDLDGLSALLDFQNWTYINSSEGSLYREFFQKIMDSNSPFYLFIYVPMILGIVSIVLGTRVTLPHKVKASHDESITVDPKFDRYHSDYNGRGA